jgi:hypothetical protein
MTSLRRSPPTQRVVTLLDYFAARPDERFGLSELARAVEMSKPTCLGIVTTLVESAYLTCDGRTKTYSLGPALVRVGRCAQDAFSAADVARRHLTDLAGREPFVAVGQRYPFAPPMGLMHVAWRDDLAFAQWLKLPPTVPGPLDVEHLRAIVADARERGFLVEGLTTAGRQLHSLVAGVAAYDLPEELRELVGEMVANLGERVYLGSDVGARTKYPVSVLAAPTFDAEGEQDLVLSLYVGHSISGAEIARRGRVLAQAAETVTTEAGGYPPKGKGRP